MKRKTRKALTDIIAEQRETIRNQDELIQDQKETITLLRLEKERYRRKLQELHRFAEVVAPISERKAQYEESHSTY